MKTLSMFLLVLGIQAQSKNDKLKWPVIGIDLGTKNSCVGIFRQGKVEIIPNDQGKRKTQSIVAFTDEVLLIGNAANNQAIINPSRTLYNIKRLMGRKFTDPTVQNDRKFMPYEIVEKDNKPYIMVQNINGFSSKIYAPEEISAMVLIKMKEISETYLGEIVENAVLTVPAYFNDVQRQATKDAGTIAGLNVVRILNEPTAAGIAYGFSKRKLEENIIVFDLGGGTYDVSILSIDDGVFQVIATSGDTNFGGEDFDQRVIDYFIKVIQEKHNKDISADKRAIQKLKREVVKAKIALSDTHETKLEIEDLVDGLYFQETLTRSKFEDLNNDLFNKLTKPFVLALADSKLTENEISEIILVGGCTRIPKVRQIIEGFFQKINVNAEINPEEAVCQGAAIQGAVILGESKDIKDLLAIDVTSFSLGIKHDLGIFINIIPKGSNIPQMKSEIQIFFKGHMISVYEGEELLAKNNNKLGNFYLDQSRFNSDERVFPSKNKGIFESLFELLFVRPMIYDRQIEIEFTFQIDDDGILHASANYNEFGKKINFYMKHPGLSEEEIKRMQQDTIQTVQQIQATIERVDTKYEQTNSIFLLIQKIYNIIKYPKENEYYEL